MAVDRVVLVSCKTMGVGVLDFEVMALELDSSFRVYFYLELAGMKEWTSGK